MALVNPIRALHLSVADRSAIIRRLPNLSVWQKPRRSLRGISVRSGEEKYSKFYDYGKGKKSHMDLNFDDGADLLGDAREDEEYVHHSIDIPDLSSIPYFGTTDEDQPNDEGYESWKVAPLDPEDEEMQERAVKILNSLLKFYEKPWHNFFQAQNEFFNPADGEKKIISDSVHVEDPLGVMIGSKNYESWLCHLSKCGVSIEPEHLYMEHSPKPEDRFTRWIHASWHMELSPNLAASLQKLDVKEWWDFSFPVAMAQFQEMSEDPSLPDNSQVNSGTLTDNEDDPLDLWGHTCFTVNQNGQVGKIESDWFMLEGEGGPEYVTKAHLFLSVLRELQSEAKWKSR